MQLHFQKSESSSLLTSLNILLYFYRLSFIYPTLDELAAQLLFVLSHFGLKSVIGFGIGAGANILTRFALQQPDKVGNF